jgi:hypothetical protein
MSISREVHVTASPSERLDEVMAIAGHLAGDDTIRAVHVVTNDRPTYDGLRRLRSLADASDLAMAVNNNSIVLRPIKARSETAAADSRALRDEGAANRRHIAGAWHSSRPRAAFAPRVGHWLHTHLGTWNAGFTGLSDGTR